MLVASKPQGPRYLPVIGAEILFDPIDRPMMRRARRAALKALQRPDDEEEADVDPVVQLEDLGDALSFALIVEGARDWRDVAIGRLDDMGVRTVPKKRKPKPPTVSGKSYARGARRQRGDHPQLAPCEEVGRHRLPFRDPARWYD